MLPLLTRAASRQLDTDAVTRLGLPSIVLMENAARGALDMITQHFSDRLGRVVLVGGVGQNGGDAWAIARHLCTRGLSPRCVLVGDPDQVTGDASVNLQVLRALGVTVDVVADASRDDATLEPDWLHGATLVIDGLFGTGLTRNVAGVHAAVIERMNTCGAPVASLDLPSGIDADTGAVLGVAVRAALTVTFATRKPGLLQYPGRDHAGEVVCVDIGVPADRDSATQLLEAHDIASWLPARAANAHKGVSGHVLIVAGSAGTSGAAVLAGLGALRMGAGLVSVATRAARSEITTQHPELMVHELPTTLEHAIAVVERLCAGKSAVVLGPGLGLDDVGQQLARQLAHSLTLPTVLDADALTAFAGRVNELVDAQGPRVLTPHPAEAARLLGTTTVAVQADRYAAARSLAAAGRCIAVLKGAGTVIADADGHGWVCDRGTPALGVAGTGDVLAGALGTLLGQGTPTHAACAAAYLHGLAGELSTEHDRGLLASEVAGMLPSALARCRA